MRNLLIRTYCEIRVAKLEQQITGLTERVDRLSGVIPRNYLPGAEDKHKRRPGPEKNIDDDELPSFAFV